MFRDQANPDSAVREGLVEFGQRYAHPGKTAFEPERVLDTHAQLDAAGVIAFFCAITKIVDATGHRFPEK